MSFDVARALADAVLLEGYVLYPYRASSPKNQFRFAFGTLAPRAWSEAGGCEPWWMRAECLVEGDAAQVEGRVRFLRVVRRTVEAEGRPVAELESEGALHVAWDEGEVCELALRPLAMAEGEVVTPIALEGGYEETPLRGGRVVRTKAPVRGRVRARAERIEGDRPLFRVSITVENLTEGVDPEASRDAALAGAMASTHLLLAARDGGFISLLDPPAWAQEAARACESVRCYPVLAGLEGTRELILAAPIILYDHAQIAPESPGDFFDATEIDALLALRTATLTDAEKRAARATDPRAAAIVDRVESMPPEVMERLHGAVRELEPAGEPPALAIGARVRLRPGHRRTDAQDLLFAGCVATVEAVLKDVEGRDHVAVTIDEDPAAELNRWYGRFHYYYLDEVEPLE